MNNCLYSRSTLSLLISLLPQGDFIELKREMTRRDIDYNNPVGPLMFACFKDYCKIERNAMEGEIADEPKPPLIPQRGAPKLKMAHGANYQSCSSSEDEYVGVSHGNSNRLSSEKSLPPRANWYLTGLKFPCPLNNHKHETMACTLCSLPKRSLGKN